MNLVSNVQPIHTKKNYLKGNINLIQEEFKLKLKRNRIQIRREEDITDGSKKEGEVYDQAL